jgi:micrococcal nuclease
MKLKIFLLLFLTLFILGCTQQEQPSITPTPTITTTPATSAPETTATPFTPQFGVRYTVKVVEVIDGDTIDVILPDGTKDRVRMLCIDSPEPYAEGNKPNEYDSITDLDCLEYWGKQAKAFAYSNLQGKEIQIEFDETAGLRGYYGRLLAYVYYDSTDFTAELVKRGYARVYEEGECRKESEYLQYQQQAMQSNLGLWSCRYAVTTTAPAVTTSTAVKIKTSTTMPAVLQMTGNA